MPDAMREGLDAYRRRAWRDAIKWLTEADGDGHLDGHGLDRLAEAAYLVGDDDTAARSWERAHLAHLSIDDPDAAARSAFWLALCLLLKGDTAPATGWLARAGTILDEAASDCAARGYLLVAESIAALGSGDAPRAESLSHQAAELGRRFGDRDLWALGWLGRGEAAVATGEIARGMSLLDEVMVAATAGELSPIVTGIVYCAVIEACMRGHDLRRAAQWTEKLSRWCDEQSDLVPFRGQCRVHRAQVFHARGDWQRAASEASGADRLLADPPHPARGLALYVLGELHRLQGADAAAEAAYREAARLGFPPVPGLSLLRLAQGRLDAAKGAIRRALEETTDGPARPVLLAAAVEIFATAEDHDAVSAAVAELEQLVAEDSPPVLAALAQHARGAAALAMGDAASGLRMLRRAWEIWQELDMPYEAARARVLIASACRAIGDTEGADVEIDSARAVFARLGAAPELERLAKLATSTASGGAPLSARECDVLRLVAAGHTNKEVGAALRISEHTVARHLQNAFVKLGVSSRAAAVATALERGLV